MDFYVFNSNLEYLKKNKNLNQNQLTNKLIRLYKARKPTQIRAFNHHLQFVQCEHR